MKYKGSYAKAFKKSDVVLVMLFNDGNYGIVYGLRDKRLKQKGKKRLDFEMKIYDDSVNFNDCLAAYSASLN